MSGVDESSIRASTTSALVATLAAVGASLVGVFATAGPAAAKTKCKISKPKSGLAPYLTSPCSGGTVKIGSNVTFKAFDDNSLSGKYHPYVNVQTKKIMEHGHLKPNGNGNGVFDQMKPNGKHTWIDVAKHQIYPTWFANKKGTYYVQIQQIDSRAGTGGIFYSPIVTIHVGGAAAAPARRPAHALTGPRSAACARAPRRAYPHPCR